MFLKEKRCGKIKGRGCADGRKQRVYKTKDETSAPTIYIESLFLLCMLNAKENRYTVTCDVPLCIHAGRYRRVDPPQVGWGVGRAANQG